MKSSRILPAAIAVAAGLAVGFSWMAFAPESINVLSFRGDTGASSTADAGDTTTVLGADAGDGSGAQSGVGEDGTAEEGTGEETVEVSAPAVTVSASSEPRVSVSQSPSAEPGAGSSGSSSGGATVAASVVEAEREFAREIFALANGARTSTGLSALTWNDCAASEATDRSRRALPKPSLEHEPITFACANALSGENLARTGGGATRMHQLWMNSDGHRANILSDGFAQLGVGCTAHSRSDAYVRATTVDDIGGMLCSQMFYG